mgnify:CR=1 FL=1
MMVIRPVERSDVSALMQLASKTGGGLTSLPANEATLSARIERAIKTWQGELPKSEQGYVFVLEDSETGTVAGICAIEVAAVLNHKAGRKSWVRMDGGDLHIHWDEKDGHVYMTGPAGKVFEGEIEM